MDENKWQVMVAECEKLSEATGAKVLPLQPPAEGQPVGLEWADPWVREGRYLDWLTSFLMRVNGALQREDQEPEAGSR
jgi:hypothetical protein